MTREQFALDRERASNRFLAATNLRGIAMRAHDEIDALRAALEEAEKERDSWKRLFEQFACTPEDPPEVSP